jgi:pyrroloquinoline quinone (PQQ) biosynthesis protein C
MIPYRKPGPGSTGVPFEETLAELLEQDARTGRDPFLDGVREGRVSRAGLRAWVQQYYLVVREFTRLLAAIYANCPEREVRAVLAENLYEEHGRFVPEKDHPALMRKLGRRLGLTDEAMERAPALPETARYLAVLAELTRDGSYLEGLAGVALGVEYLMPRYFARLEPLLRARYDLSTDDTEFLRVHITEDAEHGRRALTTIVERAREAETQARVMTAIRRAHDARREYREAIFRQCTTV